MSKAEMLRAQLRLPVIAAPMFLVSSVDLVVGCCRAGVIGTIPAHNGPTPEALDGLLGEIRQRLADCPGAPYGVNIIIHRTNPRHEADLECCIRHQVPIVITSLGKPSEVVEQVHQYGGLVFSDVTTITHARKAAEAGVDGLILVCAGAGGHAGTLNPFAFVPAAREFFNGILVVAGAISNGRAIRACEVLGADLVYMGTRFLATAESGAAQGHKDMAVASSPEDLVYTPVVTGVPATFLRRSLEQAGYDLDQQDIARIVLNLNEPGSVWSRAWSAGQGVAVLHKVATVQEVVDDLLREYAAVRG